MKYIFYADVNVRQSECPTIRFSGSEGLYLHYNIWQVVGVAHAPGRGGGCGKGVVVVVVGGGGNGGNQAIQQVPSYISR